jgi:hypothetical protein
VIIALYFIFGYSFSAFGWISLQEVWVSHCCCPLVSGCCCPKRTWHVISNDQRDPRDQQESQNELAESDLVEAPI